MTEKVDLIAFSSAGLFFDHKVLAERLDPKIIYKNFKIVLEKKTYSLLIFSLKRRYLKLIFQNESETVLDLIIKNYPQTTFFIFGARSVTEKIKTKAKTKFAYIFTRRGVARYTEEFKNMIITHIKGIRR